MRVEDSKFSRIYWGLLSTFSSPSHHPNPGPDPFAFINEHCDKLRQLAAQADSVVEFGMRHGVSTVALLAGQPRQMISYDLHQDPVADLLKSRQGATAFSFVQGDSLSVDIEPCNVLFTDRPRTDLDRAQMPRCLQR